MVEGLGFRGLGLGGEGFRAAHVFSRVEQYKSLLGLWLLGYFS